MKFKNKVVIVTGAVFGIGLLTAQRFAEVGAKVMLMDINWETVPMGTRGICSKRREAIGA